MNPSQTKTSYLTCLFAGLLFVPIHQGVSETLVPKDWELLPPQETNPKDGFYHNGYYWRVNVDFLHFVKLARSLDGREWEDYQLDISDPNIHNFNAHTINATSSGIMLLGGGYNIEETRFKTEGYYQANGSDSWKHVFSSNLLDIVSQATSLGDRWVIALSGRLYYSDPPLTDWKVAVVSSGLTGTIREVYTTGDGYVAVGYNHKVFRSEDGTHWQADDITRKSHVGVAYGNGVLVIVDWFIGNSQEYSYTDSEGFSHTREFAQGKRIVSISFAGGIFIVSGSDSDGSFFAVSKDGTTWEYFPQDFSATFAKVVYNPDKNQWLALGEASAISNGVVNLSETPSVIATPTIELLPEVIQNRKTLELRYPSTASFQLQSSKEGSVWTPVDERDIVEQGTENGSAFFRWLLDNTARTQLYRLIEMRQ